MLTKIVNFFSKLFAKIRTLDFLALLALRLYLVPIFWMSGTTKLYALESTIHWFGHPERGLDLPFPELMAYLATFTEIAGAVLLLIGLAVRWISIPLMVVMVVAATLVHADNGWLIIADQTSDAAQRLSGLLTWLQQHHPVRHEFITELGKPVMLNNGVEFAVTYFIMLFTLFFYGAGRYVSCDYWLGKHWHKRHRA